MIKSLDASYLVTKAFERWRVRAAGAHARKGLGFCMGTKLGVRVIYAMQATTLDFQHVRVMYAHAIRQLYHTCSPNPIPAAWPPTYNPNSKFIIHTYNPNPESFFSRQTLYQ